MSLSRRGFLGATGLALAGCTARAELQSADLKSDVSWQVPAETVPHTRTWMAFPWRTDVWGRFLPGVQADVALVARTIAKYEPVVLCATQGAAAHARARCGPSVNVIASIPVDDCWMRDSGPVFRHDPQGRVGAVGLNFNGWGGRQVVTRDQHVAQRVTDRANAPFEAAPFTSEGGALESDGDGTIIATESSLINDNRNPGMTREQIEAAVFAAYGASKMIWVPGLRDHDITDDHIDATSRFIRPGVVMVQLPQPSRTDAWAEDARQQFKILSHATDAKSRRLQVVPIRGPSTVRSTYKGFVDSYVNFALARGAVITTQFGDREQDRAAHRTLTKAFPGRVVEQLNIDRLCEGGGGVHCITQQQPTRPTKENS